MTLNEIESEITRRLSDGSFPGAVTLIASKGKTKYFKAFGFSVALPQKIQADRKTIYDVASLTKPLITANLILQLIQEEKLSVEMPLSELFPECPKDKESITIEDLLCHRSGIVWWYPLYARGASISEYRDIIFNLPLACPPRREAIYSCPGYVLLASIIENILGMPYHLAAKDRIISPLGLDRTFLGEPEISLEEVAATEDSSFYERGLIKDCNESYSFREGIIWGQSHDTNSFAAGGSAGNAGLFSTAEEVLMLTEQFGPRSTLLNQKVLSLVGPNGTPFGPQHRTIGWQLASSPDSSACPELNPDSIGHTAFTGCSVWFDRLKDLTIVLLTNRVHPQLSNADMLEVRRNICALAVRNKLFTNGM